jgi:hypothetical protein
MYCFAFIGMTGTGKTFHVKKYIQNKKSVFVFDVNNEYHFPANNPEFLKSRDTILNMSDFLKECHLKRNTVCIFEDATGFFKGRVASSMTRLLQGKRHTGNTYILLFHSIRNVPPDIRIFLDFITLFKTNDNIYDFNKRFPGLIPSYYKLKSSKNLHSKFIIKNLL